MNSVKKKWWGLAVKILLKTKMLIFKKNTHQTSLVNSLADDSSVNALGDIANKDFVLDPSLDLPVDILSFDLDIAITVGLEDYPCGEGNLFEHLLRIKYPQLNLKYQSICVSTELAKKKPNDCLTGRLLKVFML